MLLLVKRHPMRRLQRERGGIAHELTHVEQQTGSTRLDKAVHMVQVPGVRRIIKVFPPGGGEGSAFDCRKGLMDNKLPGIEGG
jgi:hypothetical protein